MNVGAQTAVIEESFDKAEPTGWFRKNATTELRDTRQPGWKTTLGQNKGRHLALVEDKAGNRRLVFRSGGRQGEDQTEITCPLPEPIQPARLPVIIESSFTPTGIHTAGPDPLNKQFCLSVRDRATDLAYGVALDIQARRDAPDNRLFFVYLYTPDNAVTIDNTSPLNYGFWFGPRMAPALKHTRFDVKVTFEPVADQDGTRVKWEWMNIKTGERQHGKRLLPHAMSADVVFDELLIDAKRWTNGRLDNIAVRVGEPH